MKKMIKWALSGLLKFKILLWEWKPRQRVGENIWKNIYLIKNLYPENIHTCKPYFKNYFFPFDSYALHSFSLYSYFLSFCLCMYKQVCLYIIFYDSLIHVEVIFSGKQY